MKNELGKWYIFTALFLLCLMSYSQGKSSGHVPPTPPGLGKKPIKPHPELPIDGGLSFLIIAGVAYGVLN